jgi:tetratricopeptide (TPR) repeat protein
MHLTSEQLSQLVDGSISDPERVLLEEHLRSCRDCFGAYEDALRYHAVWHTDPAVFRAPAAIAAVAHETPRRAAREKARAEREAQRLGTRAGWRSLMPAAVAAVVVVALVGALAMWRPDVMEPARGEYSEFFVPVKAAVEEASTGGAIMLPGAESVAATTVPSFRSGRATASEHVSAALVSLARAYRDEDTPPEVAHWLISGFLAVGELENARLYAEDSRRRYPGDERFVVLEAIVAYRSNDMKRAERLLQLALRENPHSGAALLNLGLVQYEQGQFDVARQTLESVRREFAGSPLELRAAALLNGLLGG